MQILLHIFNEIETIGKDSSYVEYDYVQRIEGVALHDFYSLSHPFVCQILKLYLSELHLPVTGENYLS